MSNPSLRRKFQEKFEQKADKPVYMPALLGNGMGQVNTGIEGLVWVRVNDMPTTAVCTALPPVNDLPVWVYKPVFDPTRYYVQGQRIYGTDDPIQSGSDAHAEQHRLFGSGAKGGTDILWIDPRQILGLRIYGIENTLQVGIIPWHVMIGDTYKLIGTVDSEGNYTAVTVDLSENVVTTEDKARFVLITLDDDGEVVATAGSEVDIDALDISVDLPAIPADTRIVLGAVRMYWGQVQIEEGRSNTDIVDLRWLFWHRHEGSELALDIGDLGDVTITDLGDGEIIVSSSGSFINRTLAEAGVAAVGHNHTESDITDLDHDAVKIDGITVDLTGIADGDALVYDVGTSKIIPGEGGGGTALTVQEIDGTPSVGNVAIINVTNGTLTDDGSGEITLNFGSAATDGSAIHDNEADEISAITEKTTLADDDMFIIEDSEASNVKKMVKASNLPAGGSGETDVLMVQVFS